MVRTLIWVLCFAVLVCLPLTSLVGSASASAANLYAGTSNPGVVWEYAGGTTWEAISPELGWSVLCLTQYEGTLYAGTISMSYTGQVYRYDGGGSWSLVGDNMDHQVASLQVYDGDLHAGTAWSGGRLYRYDAPGSWTRVVDCGAWSGVRALYTAQDGWLYMGDIGWDKIGRFDGTNFYYLAHLGGSCIYDFAEFEGSIYAAAWAGRLIGSYDGVSWFSVLYHDGYIWEIEPFQGYLYMGHQNGDLRRLDGASSETVWTAPAPIISMAADADTTLWFGTGGEAGYLGSLWGLGQVYQFDGTSAPELISPNLGAGVQCLALTPTEAPIEPPQPGYDTAHHRRFWVTARILADYAHRLFVWIERLTGGSGGATSRNEVSDPEAREVLSAAATVSESGWYSWVLGKVLDLGARISESWGKTATALMAVLKTVDLTRFYLTVDDLFDSFFTMRGESDEGARALRNAEGYLNQLPRVQVENYLACADVDFTYEEWRAMDPVQRFSLLAQCEAFQLHWVYTTAARKLIEAGFPVAGYPSP